MEIKISRINTNALYTLSEFRINGSHFAFVLESTPNMLPKSKYIVRLSKHSCRKQNIYLSIPISPRKWPSFLATVGRRQSALTTSSSARLSFPE